MSDEKTIEDLLARLERERLAADRHYNAALTALDRALQAVPQLPAPPPAYDPSRLAEINAAWDILPGGTPPLDDSFKGRLRRLVWRMVGPPLESQKQFNAAIVDHLNRNRTAHESSSAALAGLIASVGRELEALVRFESLLIQSLQTVTAYVDTKDRSLGGGEIRQRLALTEQRLLALKRVVEAAAPAADRAAPEAAAVFTRPVDSVTYVAFEDAFRGSREEIARRVRDYVPLFAGTASVVDIGCGRGELLALFAAAGVRARGVDINPAMVEACRAQGFEVEQGDALSYLQRQPDTSLGGLIAIQVVEHFTPAYLVQVLETAFHKLSPGAALVLETINPACWLAFFDTYLRDLTHQQPLHPDTLRHLVQSSGFSDVDIQFRQPVADSERLDHVDPPPATQTDGIAAITAALNAHADKLNRLLFSSMDYALIARKL